MCGSVVELQAEGQRVRRELDSRQIFADLLRSVLHRDVAIRDAHHRLQPARAPLVERVQQDVCAIGLVPSGLAARDVLPVATTAVPPFPQGKIQNIDASTVSEA